MMCSRIRHTFYYGRDTQCSHAQQVPDKFPYFLEEKILKVLDGEPVHLPPWDPMGALTLSNQPRARYC